jgi:hypothetical protein
MGSQANQASFIRAATRPLAAGLASLALCATLHYAAAPPPAPESVDLSCKLPTLTPLAETKAVQGKGGIVFGVSCLGPFLRANAASRSLTCSCPCARRGASVSG